MGAGLAFKDKVTREVAENQFYPTPDDGTVEALLNSPFAPSKGAHIWEPAVGGWGIADVLERHGHSVVGSDIKDYGVEGRNTIIQDFTTAKYLRAINIITNPPYNAAGDNVGDRFIFNALRLNPAYLALLLKADFFCTEKSLGQFFNTYGESTMKRQPAAVMPLTWRPDFSGQKKPFLTVQWVVWDANVTGNTTMLPLDKPCRAR